MNKIIKNIIFSALTIFILLIIWFQVLCVSNHWTTYVNLINLSIFCLIINIYAWTLKEMK